MNNKITLQINDYVNCKFINLPKKIISELVSTFKFLDPQSLYSNSVKIGRWDGMVEFFKSSGVTYVQLLDRILPVIIEHNIDIEIIDKRSEYNFDFSTIDNTYLSDIKWYKGHRLEHQPIILADHQVNAINYYLNDLQSVQQLATSAGKTIITAALCRIVEQHGRTITIVPSKDLVKQTYADYVNIGLDVGVFYGNRKEVNHRHIITTWQSLVKLRNGSSATDITWDEFIKDVIAVLVDEVHGTSKDNELKKLLCVHLPHIPIRWGMTGTIPKEDFKSYAILVGVGPLVNTVSAKHLQDIGHISNCHIQIIKTKENKKFVDYISEKNFILTDNKRLKWISDLIDTLKDEGPTLVLVEKIDTGVILSNNLSCPFTSGSVNDKKRSLCYSELNVGDINKLIATYGIAAVGINIPGIRHLVLIECGKSLIRVMQSIGRGLRKTETKSFVQIWDISANTKYSTKHLSDRIKLYDEAQYKYDLIECDYL